MAHTNLRERWWWECSILFSIIFQRYVFAYPSPPIFGEGPPLQFVDFSVPRYLFGIHDSPKLLFDLADTKCHTKEEVNFLSVVGD
ncbi:hypothetical protein CEXT_200371 [Caerostris extrusa]|uniref:Uncharacterized protein n=1 Tax=Caerostris extrusa TaxID=172846 RepID=A0AAV4T1X6_CAEEX|nr:hypothetical protein CEXT_200371 [Caerostris extrusa]